MDVVLEDLSRVNRQTGFRLVVGNGTYVSRDETDDCVLEETPRVGEMVQTPCTSLDQEETTHPEDICHQPLHASL